MKKIRLDLESLEVESFVTSGGPEGGEGTVFAMATICEDTCNGVHETCVGEDPCASDYPECDYTNGGTCDTGNTEWCTQLATCPTLDWTCEACVDSCNSEECKTD